MTQHTCGSNGCGHASDCAVHNEPAMPAGSCDCSVEAEIQAKGRTAPRVTPDDIQREIVGEHYFTAAEGVAGEASLRRGLVVVGDTTPPPALGLLTFCVLVLRNGFTVTGESACASPENFDAEIGCRIARENAVQKIWLLLGFRLRDRLAGVNDPSKAEQVLGEVLSVVQHYLPPDGGTAHDAMGEIIGLVDPWPLHARPLPCGTKPRAAQSPIDVAAEEYARAEQNLSMSKLHSREAQDAVTAAFEAERAADETCKAAMAKLAEAALPKHPDATQG